MTNYNLSCGKDYERKELTREDVALVNRMRDRWVVVRDRTSENQGAFQSPGLVC